MERSVYLAMKSLEEAREMFFARFGPDLRTGVETVRVEDARGRVTAAPLFAFRSAPSYHSSAMDGIAVKAETTYGTTERHPTLLEIGRDCEWVNTGQPLPAPFDAVIMVEKVHEADDGRLEIRAPAHPWQHVRKVGEDIVATQLVLPMNHRLRPWDLGCLVSAGVFLVEVWKRPSVIVIPTGSELVDHRTMAEAGTLDGNEIIEYNSLVLGGLVTECGAVPVIHDIVPDVRERIRDAVLGAVDAGPDLVIINAGSSAGTKDYTVHVIGELGEVFAHGVAMMPGKPTILGAVKDTPVVGIPGYPVSASLSFEQFVSPLLYRLQGLTPPERPRVTVHTSRDVPSKLGIEEFLRVNIGSVGSRYIATPLGREAGSITTLTRAEGIVRIPARCEGISRHEEIEAELLVDEDELRNTVVVIGSHDISLDVLADEIRSSGRTVRISSGNVGSLGGLMALRKETCHMAGSHLLDPRTGEYNLSYIRRYLPGVPVSVFHLVLRDQGLMVPAGNPKAIRGIEDLERDDVTFINRQAGSGTRVLLDYELARLGIDGGSIRGYDRDEYTHMAVAVDVLSGAADCGMGIRAAARALDLEFIPLVQEQYDLVIPTHLVSRPTIQAVLDTIGSDRFRSRVTALGGYDPAASGELWVELNGKEDDNA